MIYYSATSLMLKLNLPILSFPRHTTFTTSPSFRTSSTLFTLSFRDLGNMHHSLFSRSKLNECTKFFDADHFSLEYLTSLKICHDRCDQFGSFFHALFLSSADRYCSVVLDVDLHAGLFDDRIDGLSYSDQRHHRSSGDRSASG